MNTTLVINPKGGSGKTTVTVNLASYFAAANVPTAIMDYDPQGSSLNWLRLRSPQAPKIHAANAARHQGVQLRSLAMYVPERTEQLIIDAPAGAAGLVLQEMLDRASCIIVPVPPSPIDIHASANFVAGVLGSARMQSRRLPVAIVANKVRRSMPQYAPFDGFLSALALPLLARLVDSDVYLKAAEAGVGIFEMEAGLALAERRQFMPIVEWVRGHERRAAAPPEREVFELARRMA
ncbi:MAG TPA: ParA family protein [Burkholderiales bacterium]|nr:ParA family protein [Burkholderiales bacterium]